MARLVAALAVNLMFIVAASPAYAQPEPARIQDLEKVIENIIKLLAPAAAIAFLAMVILGAYKFIVSGGDQKGTSGARTTLTYAILGILLVASAVLILRVIRDITGQDVTIVTIPGGP